MTFSETKVHGDTDESIVIDTAITSGIAAADAEAGVARFHKSWRRSWTLAVTNLLRSSRPIPASQTSIAELHREGFVQTVIFGRLVVP